MNDKSEPNGVHPDFILGEKHACSATVQPGFGLQSLQYGAICQTFRGT